MTSLSPSSSDNHAAGRPLPAIHPAASVVLPKPAGAEMSVSLDSRPSFKRSIKRGRSTTPDLIEGTWSFVSSMGMEQLVYSIQRNR